jgi:hypothetical protein
MLLDLREVRTQYFFANIFGQGAIGYVAGVLVFFDRPFGWKLPGVEPKTVTEAKLRAAAKMLKKMFS